MSVSDKKDNVCFRQTDGSLTRRQFTLGSLATLAAMPFAGTALKAHASSPVTFASYGGYYNDAIQKTLIDAFVKSTGINVRMASNASLANLKGQINANAVQWDVAELTGSEYEIAMQQGVPLEPLDFNIIQKENIPDYAIAKHGIRYAYFLTVMGWDKQSVAVPPKNWREFFDPKLFPQRRSLSDHMNETMVLEFALLADGVALDNLYPLDVDRALGVLSKLDSDEILWYRTNQQIIEQMQSGESQLGMPYIGRLRIANEGGANIGYTTNDGGAIGDYLVVPKGAPNVENAMKLINFICSDAAAGAAFMNRTYYGLSNIKANKLLDATVAANIPTNPALKDKVFIRDDKWWAKNLDAVTQKFQAWQIKHS